ncbi:MAG: peptidase associated/transthyretin-like domain-containing protein [Planctomycetota bacterium]|jgi:hypothetical protein
MNETSKRSLARALVLATLALGGAAGCGTQQTLEIRTVPTGADVYHIRPSGQIVPLGAAPVRFSVRQDETVRVRARAEGYEPAEANVPGGEDIQAFIDLTLSPNGASIDEMAVLELLLTDGPLPQTDLSEKLGKALPNERLQTALKALSASGEVRVLRADAVDLLDLEPAGLRRLRAALPETHLLERLLASRRDQARRLFEAKRDAARSERGGGPPEWLRDK